MLHAKLHSQAFSATAAFVLALALATPRRAPGQPAPVQAAEARATTLKPELELFAPMIGDWDCAGAFTKSGKPISSTLHVAPILEGAWLAVHQDDRPPNPFHALELWGFDKASHQFLNFIYDNFGGARRFSSPGWDESALTWSRSDVAPGASTERFVFKPKSPGQLQVTWQVKKPGEDWATGDTLACEKQ